MYKFFLNFRKYHLIVVLSMDLHSVIKNPLITMGRYTVVIVQDLGRIVLFFKGHYPHFFQAVTDQ